MSLIGTIRDGISGISANVKANSQSGKNELLVNQEGHICDLNSTSTALGIGEVFTGEWEDTLDYGIVTVGVNADQDSAANGLDLQWSADGVNVHDHDNFTILANIGKIFTFGPARRYVRLVYTNGSVAQTSFNIETSLRRVYVKPSSHRISDSIIAEDDAQLVKSVITGQREDGVFKNATLDNGNNLRVNSILYTYSISKSEVAGHTSLLKFGTRTSIAAATQSTIWEGPTALYAYMSTAQQLKVSSSSAQDGPGGTGFLTMRVHGLDANWNEISEVITMNGTSVVTTTNSFIRIYRAYGVTSGSSLTNVGTITITNNAGTVTQLVINANDGQTLMTLWTVPVGKVAYLVNGTLSTDSNKGVRVSLFTRLNDGGTLYPWQIKYRAYIFSGNNSFPFTIPFVIPAKTDLEVRVTTPASAGTTSAGATFELWYENV